LPSPAGSGAEAGFSENGQKFPAGIMIARAIVKREAID
jgi:hypothetical protein